MKNTTIILILLCSAVVFGAWDNDLPSDSQTWNTAAGSIRDNNDALEDVLGVDLLKAHPPYQPTFPTTRPGGVTDLDSDDLGRLWIDSDDDILYGLVAIGTPDTWLQISASPAASNTFAVAQSWTLGTIKNTEWLRSTDNAGTGTVNLMMVDAADQAFIADETWTVTNAAPVDDKALANKKYVDDNALAAKKVVTTTTTTKTTVETNDPASSPFVQSEGVEIVTVTISSLTVGDIIEVEGFVVISSSSAQTVQSALFADAIAASIAVGGNDSDDSGINGHCSIGIKGWFTATGASHTFKMRAIGKGGTTTVNNAFGGEATSWITATRMLAGNIAVN